ncbi:hypothetical protein SAMN05216525_1667 [Bradyrhizobium sp. Gha]|nr:hypothetical protein SAMN05216525_1667 [Bradyrhizobium sp. Gha]
MSPSRAKSDEDVRKELLQNRKSCYRTRRREVTQGTYLYSWASLKRRCPNRASDVKD